MYQRAESRNLIKLNTINVKLITPYIIRLHHHPQNIFLQCNNMIKNLSYYFSNKSILAFVLKMIKTPYCLTYRDVQM